MQRRQYLGSLAAGVALAGCSGDGEDGPGDPAATVESLISHINDGDYEAANELIGDDGEFEKFDAEDAAELETITIAVTETEVISDDGETAVVEAVVRFGEGAEAEVDTATYELRAVDGEWRVWDGEFG